MNESLAGLWAHLLDTDGHIERQVQIIRPGPGGYGDPFWLVQNYEWIGGDATTVSAVRESVLLDEERCVLYLDSDAMNFAYEYGPLGRQTHRAREAETL